MTEKAAKRTWRVEAARDSHKKRPKAFVIHVSVEELTAIQAAAEKEYLPPSAWARRVLLKLARGESNGS